MNSLFKNKKKLFENIPKIRQWRNVNKSQGFFKRKSELNKIGAQVKELNTQIKLLSGNRQTLVEAIEIADLNQKENIREPITNWIPSTIE